MMHKTKSEKTKTKEDEIVASMTTEQIFNQKLVRVARTVTLKPLSGASLLVKINGMCIVQINSSTELK